MSDDFDEDGHSSQSQKFLSPLWNTPISKKSSNRQGWDKIRDAVMNIQAEGCTVDSISAPSLLAPTSTLSTPASSHPSTHTIRPGQRTSLFSFSKNSNDQGFIANGDHRGFNFAATTVAAAQAAGMTNFGRSLRPGRAQAGGIYAATTSVQQDIYRLERDIEKLLLHLNAHSQYTSFSVTEEQTNTSGATKRTLFPLHSRADIFHAGTHTPMRMANTAHDDIRSDHNRIAATLVALMETLHKHKLATRMPLANDVLAILSLPFDQRPLIVEDCGQSLDILDYLRERFHQSDPHENFSQLVFCGRLLQIDHMGLKMRIISTLKLLLGPCMGNSKLLPSTPFAFQSLVFTLSNALTQHTHQTSVSGDNHPREADHIRAGIIDLLDTLAEGNVIPVEGETWKEFCSADAASLPVALARLCVVESLAKTLMVGSDTQANSCGAGNETNDAKPIERARDKLILKELLPRYFVEPTDETLPAYLRVVLVLCEVTAEKFLNATLDDLKQPASTTVLLLDLVKEKFTPEHLQEILTHQQDDPLHAAVIINIIAMLLQMLSVTSLQDVMKFTPDLRPKMSASDLESDAGSLLVRDDISIKSPRGSPDMSETAAVEKTLTMVKSILTEFWRQGYQKYILQCTRKMLEESTSERMVTIYGNLVFCIEADLGQNIVKETLPALLHRLTTSYPPANPLLNRLLVKLSRHHRSVFYKHVVSCVASNNEDKIAKHLTLMSCLRRYMSGVQFWMQDAEMISVLLLSDVGKTNKKKATDMDEEEGRAEWGTTTLGQCVVAAEFMWTIKELRVRQQDPMRNMEVDEIAKKFLIDLERRLAVFVTAKEKLALIPLPLRVLLCNIFLEMRFFCNTTHRPGWLTRAIEWAIQPVAVDGRNVKEESNVDTLSKHPVVPLHLNYLDEVMLMLERVRIIYARTVDALEWEPRQGVKYKEQLDTPNVPRRPNESPGSAVDVLLSDERLHYRHRHLPITNLYPMSREAAMSLSIDRPELPDEAHEPALGVASAISRKRLESMPKIKQEPFGAVFSLLVAVFASLTSQEYSRLIRPLWNRFVDDRNPHAFVPAAFLLMQCGEKIPKMVMDVATQDFYSDDPQKRTAAVLKHSSLSAFRFDVLAQEYIPISSRKRPFRGEGGGFSIPFVPTDLGSNRFTMDEPRWMAKLKNASNFPIELKRQIQELGWEDDDQGEEHEALKKVLTPLVLLPSLFLEEEDDRLNDGDATGRPESEAHLKSSAMVSKIMARRKRAATVQAWTASLLSMIDLLNDNYGGSSSALRELLEYFMRDDPSLFLRAILSDLGRVKIDRTKEILTRVRYLVSMQAKLPPGLTYILFNYLAGMLKWLARENKKGGLAIMTLIHPILSQLVLSSNELSARDLRKHKIEHLLASTGRFWFTQEQPSSMFPRSLTEQRTPFKMLDIPWEIFGVAHLRISHIQFLTNFLIRYPREVYAVKKTLQDYETIPIPDMERHEADVPSTYFFPRMDNELDGGDKDGIPSQSRYHIPDPRPSQQQEDVANLCVLRARVWLRFIDTLLSGLNKNYNERAELERILKGVNTIIMQHSTDFGILGQALVLYTRVVTRFKRLFVSNRGYSTFLPALFKVFCEVHRSTHARAAITFAWCRFYAVHEEAFVFQIMGTLVPMILSAYSTSTRLGTWMTENLFALMQAMHDPPRLGATSDVLGLQLQVELDDHERSIQERIDAASNPMAIPLSNTILKPLKKSNTPPMALPLVANNYANRPFPLQNFVKLFLTVIAYDPGSLRAEQFVRMLRHMLPYFSKRAGLSDLLGEGMSALIDVLVKFSKNSKPVFTGSHPSNTAPADSYHPTFDAAHGNSDATLTTGDTKRPARTPHDQQPQHPLPPLQQQQQQQQQQQHAYNKQWQQNDRLTIKKEFVLLVHTYLKHDGVLSEVSHEKMAQMIRMIMRDHGSVRGHVCPTDWIRDYLVDSLHAMARMRNQTKAFKKMLNQIYAQFRTHSKNIDAADLYSGLAIVLERGESKPVNMHQIAGVIKDRFVAYGLVVATRSDWDSTESQTRFCRALVRVIVAIMEHSTQDVLHEIEMLTPTPTLVGKVLIPLCLQYELRWDYQPRTLLHRHRSDPTSNWMRLLGYISGACNRASLLKSKTQSFSLATLTSGVQGGDLGEENEQQETQSMASTALLFALSFVAIKVIMIRGAKSFDMTRGAWVQLAYFLKSALVFGQTMKLQRPRSVSGRSSPHIPLSPSVLSPGSPDLRPVDVSAQQPVSMAMLYDFATWRFLEFVVCYKTPLVLFLRGFIHEKLRDMSPSTVIATTRALDPPSLNGNSPRLSINPGASPLDGPTPSMRARWKSWGGGERRRPSLTGEDGPLPSQPHSHSMMVPESTSPTCGLGLHIPGSSTDRPMAPPRRPSSPDTELVEEDTKVPPGTFHKSQVSTQAATNYPRPNPQPMQRTSVLHMIHAESITSLVNVQKLMGYKPALSWLVEEPKKLRPWSYRESVQQAIQEWEWMTLAHKEALLEVNKSQSATGSMPMMGAASMMH